MISRANKTASALVAIVGALVIAAPAMAQAPDPMDPDDPETYPEDPDVEPAPPPPPPTRSDDFDPYYDPDYDRRTTTPSRTTAVTVVAEPVEPEPERIGVEVSLGGGVMGFVDSDMRDTTNPGGLWDVRLAFGSRSILGVEAAYVGTAQRIDTVIGPADNGTLIGTGFEGALRLNLSPQTPFNAYAFGGLGWKRYDVTRADFSVAAAGIADEETLFEVPFGAGLQYRWMGLVADARFTYRAAIGGELVLAADPGGVDVIDDDALNLDTWGVTARIGYEF